MASPKRLHKHPPSLFNVTTTFDHHHHLVEKPLHMDDFMMMRNFVTAENNNNEQQQTSSLLSSSSSSSTASFSLMQQQQTLNNKKKSSSPTPCPEEEVLNDLVVVVKQDQDSLMNDRESSLHPHPHQDNNNVGGGSGSGSGGHGHGHDNGTGGTNEEEALSQRPTPMFGGEMMAQDYLRTVNININQRPPQLNAIVTQAEWLHFQMVAQQPQMDTAAIGSHLVAPPLFGNPIRDVVGYSDNRFVPSMAMVAGSSSLASHSILDRKRRFSDEMMEKTIERRQKRMIKNRESAARSRQKKQAYTITLETNIAHLKELNQKLEKELIWKLLQEIKIHLHTPSIIQITK